MYVGLPLLTSFSTKCSFQISGEHSGEAVEVCRDNSQMISGHCFDFESLCQLSPNGNSIIGEGRAGLGPYKLYFATIKPRPIAGQSQISAVPHPLHRRAE